MLLNCKVLASIPAFFVVLFLLYVQNAAGLLVAETPLQLYNDNELILVGKVVSRTDNSGFPSSEYEYKIKVEEYVKNPQSYKTITVIGTCCSIPGSPTFEVDDRTLLLLNKDENGRYEISSLSFKAQPNCNAHQLLGLKKFPDEVSVNANYKIYKHCISNYVEKTPDMEYVVAPPLMQLQAGIELHKLECNSGYDLVFKTNGRTPACVKSQSIPTLVSRGWTHPPDAIDVQGIKEKYKVGEKINFTIKFSGFVGCDYPHVVVKNEFGQTVWESNTLVVLCDPELGYGTQERTLDSGLGTFSLYTTGNYSVEISMGFAKVTKEFSIIRELQ